MSLRVMVIQTFYTEFLKDIYRAEPGLAELGFVEQCARLFASGFSTSDAYSHGLAALGCQSWEVICNADAAQRRWASDHGISPTGNIHDQRREIIRAQVEEFRPDVVYVFEWSPLGDAFVGELRERVGLVVGEIASPLPKDRTFRNYDLMISSWPPLVDYFRSEGIDAEHVRLGFDRRVLEWLGPRDIRHDATFVGGFAESHPDRIPWLEELLREVDIEVFCYGLERTREDSPIRRHFRGQAWGMDMYRVLQQSKITLNRHARIDVRGDVNTAWCNNMRMYEATGVGTCLLTEWRPHLADLFEPDREVATYRSTAECAEKIRYLLDHDAERESIARAGQARTLAEHRYSDRMAELLGHFGARLKHRRRPSPSAIRPANGRYPGMRIGIHPALKREDGGIYQYSVAALRALRGLADESRHEFVVFAHDLSDPVLAELEHPGWAVKTFRPPWAPKSCIDLEAPVDPDRPMQQPDMGEWLRECGVDLMLYTAPHRLSFESGVPFVMTVHDVQHRIQPEFEEVSAQGEWQRREYIYRNAARGAAKLITNSQTGRDQLLGCYGECGLTLDRVAILPYPPPEYDTARVARCREAASGKYSLPDRFLFYPAQFWPHKNHAGLIEALGLLRKNHGLHVPLVLTGSSSGEVRQRHLAQLRQRIEVLGLSDDVQFLGYVSDDDLIGLYGLAEALVMPTFFGPTNLPVLEAWALGCPVITSDVPGNGEQLSDAGILVDPRSRDSIADGILRLWTRPDQRQDLIAKGTARCGAYGSSDFARTLMRVLDDVCESLRKRRECGPPFPRREALLTTVRG